MQKLRNVAAQFGIGIGAVYGLFWWTPVAEQFDPAFLILLRQCLIIGFAVCLFISPQQLIEIGAKYLSKVLQVFQYILNISAKDKKDES